VYIYTYIYTCSTCSPGLTAEEAKIDEVNAKLAAPLMTVVECSVASQKDRRVCSRWWVVWCL
jgi:hypothetical protein